MGAEELLNIGQFGASVVLMILLRLIYNTVDLGNRLKPWVAILLGVGLGIVALFYVGTPCSFQAVVDYTLKGIMTGAAAVGYYELTQKKA